MAQVFNSVDQYRYAGKGPLDAKALIAKFSLLREPTTWTAKMVDPSTHVETEVFTAYNGMMVAVWQDTDTNNGIYFLHDPNCKTVLKTPDVTTAENWHKLGSIKDLSGLSTQIEAIQKELEAVKSDIDGLQDSATVVAETKTAFPEVGMPGRIYVATQEAMTYVWYNNDYLPVGDGGDNDEIQIISGGGPSAN